MPCSRISRSTPARADTLTSTLQLAMHAPRAVGDLHLGMDAFHQGHGLRVRQARAVGFIAALAGAVAADADSQHLTHVEQGILAALGVDAGVLRRALLAKHAFPFSGCRRASLTARSTRAA
jgi:hypothetical protein